MSGFTELHLSGALGAALESLGYAPESPEVRETVPTAARGHNLVLVAPPSAVHAVPALAGLLAHAAADGSGLRALVLCPAGTLAGFESAILPLAAAAGLRLHAADTATRAARRLREGSADLLLTTPDTALSLLERSALKGETLRALFLAWPEQYQEGTSLAPLMGEIPKDAARVIHTTDAALVNDLVERYARRALTIGLPPADGSTPAPQGPVRTVAVSDAGRDSALRGILESLDPQQLTIWVANLAGAAEVRAALAAHDAAAVVTTGDAAPGGLVIAYDLPNRARLTQLLGAGEVVLLVPPCAEPWAARALRGRRPLRIGDALDQARTEAALRRAEVARVIEAGVPDGALYALAPLLERYDATRVAAALYELWRAVPTGAGAAAAPPPPPVVMPASEVAKMWVGIGSMDNATANDLVAALVKDLKYDRTRIGKIEIREKFSLVELPATDVEAVSAALTGRSVRRRRVIARADRGTTPRSDAPSRPRKPRAS